MTQTLRTCLRFSCGVNELDNFFRYEVKECISRCYLSATAVITLFRGAILQFCL